MACLIQWAIYGQENVEGDLAERFFYRHPADNSVQRVIIRPVQGKVLVSALLFSLSLVVYACC